jgi:hypothetical protein
VSEMSSGSPDREFPKDIVPDISGLDAVAYLELRNGNYKRAELFYRRELEIIAQKEKERKASIHKGSPYFNLGRSLLLQNRGKEALRNIILAYVEDLLHVPLKEEATADTWPARTFLLKLGLSDEALSPLKVRVIEAKEDVNKWKIADPASLGGELLETLSQGGESVRFERPKPEMFDTGKLPEKKVSVFIGGPFKIAAYLRELRKIFIQVRPNYVSYMSLDFTFEEERTHDSCMTILSNCGYAIFDVSTEAGQYAEIEHARLKGIKSILVYSAAEERDKDHPPIPSNDSNSRISD